MLAGSARRHCTAGKRDPERRRLDDIRTYDSLGILGPGRRQSKLSEVVVGFARERV